MILDILFLFYEVLNAWLRTLLTVIDTFVFNLHIYFAGSVLYFLYFKVQIFLC